MTLTLSEKRRTCVNAVTLVRAEAAFIAAEIMAGLLFGGVPIYAVSFGAVIAALSFLSDKTDKMLFTALDCALIAGAGLIAGKGIISQLGRAFNAVSDTAMTRFDRLTPLMEAGGTDPAAVCFLAGLAAVGIYLAAAAKLPVRAAAAAVIVLPCLALGEGAGAVCAGLIAAGALLADDRDPAGSAARTAVLTAAGGVLMLTGAAGALSSAFTRESGAGALGLPISANKGTPALEVSMDVPQAMYLHGFIGAELDGEKWLEVSAESLDVTHEQLLYLDGAGMDAQTELYALSQTIGAETNSVTIRSADGRLYLPVTSSKGADSPCELTFPAHGRSAVTVDVPTDIYSAAESLSSAELGRLSESAGARALLGEIYKSEFSDIPESTRRILEARLGEPKEGDLTAAAEAAYKLSEGFEYDRTAADSLDEFLQVTGRGGSRQFASAAVMVFRYYGIPSRYAEGYALTPALAAGKAAGSPIELTDLDRHAWAEYYLDGAGWLPFETVPYYLAAMPQPKGVSVGVQTGGAAASQNALPADDISGNRPSRRIIDESPEGNGSHLAAIIIAGAAVCAAAVFAVRKAVFARRLRRDPCLALSKCAELLGLTPDAAGNYDLSAHPQLEGTLGRLQRECIAAEYGGGKVSCDPFEVYRACKKYFRAKRK